MLLPTTPDLHIANFPGLAHAHACLGFSLVPACLSSEDSFSGIDGCLVELPNILVGEFYSDARSGVAVGGGGHRAARVKGTENLDNSRV